MQELAKQLSLSLIAKIKDEIKQKQQISFARYMEMVLYQPGLGYYSAGLHKIGKQGDFVTSPELGSLFAKCHASQFAQVLVHLTQAVILELGAGNGSFCCDVLLSLDDMEQLPESYQILEISADLKQQQQNKIQQLPKHLTRLVSWIDRPPTKEFEGIIYANEVLDALPVEVFRYQHGEYHRLMLQWQQGFVEKWDKFPPDLMQQIIARELKLEEGYRSEFIPHLNQWLELIVHGLKKGMLLFVDYGFGRKEFYHPQRNQGTLVCHQRHRANFEPYQDVGLQDITAFVDFTAVAEAAHKANMEVSGFTSQGDLLSYLDIEQWLDPEQKYEDYYQLVSEMKKLMLPNEMGEKFKAFAATKSMDIELVGFKNNKLHHL
ncbi:MAG: SAM-dependent methyltransferase [Proteobacteria bacterium]|nr:SAM-dependent methyltransferase [Pseudomonadota bacterium]